MERVLRVTVPDSWWRLIITLRFWSVTYPTFPQSRLQLRLVLLLLLNLQQQRTIDARQNTTEGNGCADESVQLFVTTNGKLKVTRSDTLDLQVLGGVASQLQYFGSQVLEDSGHVDGSCEFVSNGEMDTGQ